MTNDLRRSYASPQDAYSKLTADSPSTPSSQNFRAVSAFLSSLSDDEKLAVISRLFEAQAVHCGVKFPADYLSLSITSAINLKEAGRSNMLYSLAKAAGSLRDDGSDTLLPLKRLPTGLIEHCLNFFTATSLNQVHLITAN